MAAITNPGTQSTEFAGEYRIVSFYNLALASADEDLTISASENGISEITNVMVCMNGGQDDGFLEVAASFSDLVVTITGVEEGGAAADEFTGTTCNLIVVGK